MKRKLRFVEDELLIRKFRDTDKDYIMSTWLHTYRNSSRCWHVAAKEYYFYEAKRMEFLLENQNTVVLCSPDNPDVLLGWCVYKPINDNLCLHYILIKQEFQGMGLAKKFLKTICQEELGHDDIEGIRMVYTYSNKIGHKIRTKYQDQGRCNWRFNPYVVDEMFPAVWKKIDEESLV